MKISALLMFPLVATALFIQTAGAGAAMLPLNGGWIELTEEKNSEGQWVFGGEWTWKSDVPVKLCLTDILVPGDIFEVYNKGLRLGQTGAFDENASGAYADTPAQGYLDEAFSHACWLLAPGEYAISIRTLQKPSLFRNDPAYAGLRAEPQAQPVPEGGVGMVLFGAAVSGLIGWRTRKPSIRQAAGVR